MRSKNPESGIPIAIERKPEPSSARQIHVKRRSLAWAGLGGDDAGVVVDDTLYDGEADACAGIGTTCVQTLKGIKDTRAVLVVETNTIVGHSDVEIFVATTNRVAGKIRPRDTLTTYTDIGLNTRL